MSIAASKIKSNSSSSPMKSLVAEQSPRLGRITSRSSTISNSTLHTNFDNNWFPNSEIVPQKQYAVTLKLSSREIEMVQNSWADILSMDGTNNGESSATSNSRSSNSRSTTKILNVNTASFASSTFCVQFYNNLITLIPGVEKLFPSIKHQAISFAGVMNSAVFNLGDLAAMHDYLENLGRRHARILGIDPPYFKKMGEALVKTFRDRYSKDMSQFSVELEELWIRLYCFLANSILQGGIDPIVKYEPNMIDSGRKSLLSDTESVLFEENASTASSLADSSNGVPAASTASSFFSTRQSLASTLDMASTTGGVSAPSRARMGSANNIDLKKKAIASNTGNRSFSKRSQFSKMKKGGSKSSNAEDNNCVLM